MNKFLLLAETGADIPSELKERYQIQTVPMHVTFGDTTRDDGEFPVEEVFEYYEKTGELPKTSGCTPNDFEVVFDRLHEQYPDRHILHLAYSAATTCSYQSALIAAEGRDYVTSIDTKHVSAGQALVVLNVAEYIEQHPDCALQDLQTLTEKLSKRCKMGFVPDGLLYLKAGGRVTNAAYIGAKILSLKPLIELVDGKLEATKKYRGSMHRIAGKFLEEFAGQYKLRQERLVFVNAAGLSRQIHDEVEAKARSMGFKEIIWIQTGCVVSTHSGPGAFGICGLSME